VRLRWEGGEEMDGVITVLEPGWVLGYTWREAALRVESVVRFELRPEGLGTLLVLEHRELAPEYERRSGTGGSP